MPFAPVAGGVQVELVHQLDGSICETGPIFLDRGPVGPADPLVLGAAVNEWWITRVLPHLSVSLSYIRYVIRPLDSASSPRTTVPLIPPLTGGEGGVPQPANVSVRVNYKVQPGQFKSMGCGFLPGIPQSAVTGNRIHADWKAIIEAAYNDLIGVAGALDWEWIVVGKWDHGHFGPGVARTEIIRAEISSPWVAQRRSRLHNVPLP
jgi:hypothetical protein